MDYIECERIHNVGYCSDNECPCTVTQLKEGQGYLYVSPEVVAFRRSALTREAVKKKLKTVMEATNYTPVSAYEPILICEVAAKKRNLDLQVAAEDAKYWWEKNLAPLRSTPTAEEGRKKAKQPKKPPKKKEITEVYIEAEESPAPDAQDKIFKTSTGALPENVSLASLVQKNLLTSDNGADNVTEDRELPSNTSDLLDKISSKDVVSNFAGTPLAEMANKMANQTSSSPINKDAITTTAISDPDLNESDIFYKFDKSISSDSSPRKRRLKRKTQKRLQRFSVIFLCLLLVVGACYFLFFQLKIHNHLKNRFNLSFISSLFNRKDPANKETPEKPPIIKVETIKEEQVIEEKEVVKKAPPALVKTKLTRSFFNSAYIFTDNTYRGSIRFIEVNEQSGMYTQKVSLKGKKRSFLVKGFFNYNPEQIVFRPDGTDNEVLWRLASIDHDKDHVVFYDPLKTNRAEAEINLIRCRSKNCQ